MLWLQISKQKTIESTTLQIYSFIVLTFRYFKKIQDMDESFYRRKWHLFACQTSLVIQGNTAVVICCCHASQIANYFRLLQCTECRLTVTEVTQVELKCIYLLGDLGKMVKLQPVSLEKIQTEYIACLKKYALVQTLNITFSPPRVSYYCLWAGLYNCKKMDKWHAGKVLNFLKAWLLFEYM